MAKKVEATEKVDKKEEVKAIPELTVAEKFLNNQIRYVNKKGMTPRRKIYMDMVRENVANTRKEELKNG